MWNKKKVRQECIVEVLQVINRNVDISLLASLKSALKTNSCKKPLSKTVIAFDANVFLRINNHPNSEDIIDFLRTSFDGELVLPSQAVQEFWNNQYNVVVTLADKIEKDLNSLDKNIRKIDESYGEFSDRFNTLLNEFRTNYGYVIDDNTLRKKNWVIVKNK